MGCTSCGTAKEGEVSGCQSKGGCSTGGCNRMNVFDWFAEMPISFNENFNIVEVSFKSGARKGFYRNTGSLDLHKGELVVVEAAQGYDVGEVSLQGELVRSQMKKRRVTERDDTIRAIMRVANEQDAKTIIEVRAKENETMVRARAISRSMNLDMKIGDIEFQGDNKKVTIFYTADDRVDFRELVKVYAKEFKVKIEMRQIGARQEAGRIGGIGTCGRELCCSTWLNDFRSVTTQTVRYQNLAINTDKLSGQCGRLKCCLNYELDTYTDALRNFPRQADRIETENGTAWLKKTEILKKQMWFEFDADRGNFYKLDIADVKELVAMNKAGKKPKSLDDFALVEEIKVDESKHEDLVGQVTLATLEEKERKKRRGNNNNRNSGSGNRNSGTGNRTNTGGSNTNTGIKNRNTNTNTNTGDINTNKTDHTNNKTDANTAGGGKNAGKGNNQNRSNNKGGGNNPNRNKGGDNRNNPKRDSNPDKDKPK